MTGQIITFPVRLWLRGARAAIRTAEDVTGAALMVTLRAAGTLSNLRPAARQTSTAPTPPSTAPTPPAAQTPPAPMAAESGPGTSPAAGRAEPRTRQPRRTSIPTNGTSAPLASERLERDGIVAPIELDDAPATEPLGAPSGEPAHVSEEPVLVREEAEPGAEDGAGAVVHVAPPWEGYEGMSAREVIARLRGAPSAVLAAVQLYETGHRKRQTVLQAVARELKSSGR